MDISQPDQYTLDDDDPQSNVPDNCLHTGVTPTWQPPGSEASTELRRSTCDRHPPSPQSSYVNWTVMYVGSKTIVLAPCMCHLGERRHGIFHITMSYVNCALCIA